MQSEERGGERRGLQGPGRKEAALHGLRMVLQPDVDSLCPVNGVGIHDEQQTASGLRLEQPIQKVHKKGACQAYPVEQKLEIPAQGEGCQGIAGADAFQIEACFIR